MVQFLESECECEWINQNPVDRIARKLLLLQID